MKQDVVRLLRWFVEKQYGCKAIAVDTATVRLKEGNATIWYGVVTIFHLDTHPAAKKAYGWYYEVEQRFMSALQAGPIASPEDAVRSEFKLLRN